MLHHHQFRAMNTDVALWLWHPNPEGVYLLTQAENQMHQAEAELSRFRPSSALSRLNRQAGCGPQVVSDQLFALLSRSLHWARESQGIFDPTLLHALTRAGYDRSFEQIRGRELCGNPAIQTVTPGHDWQEIRLDPTAGTVELPRGLGLDLGGIGKGWIVDQAAELLGQWGPALVDAGGDMRAVDHPGQPWPIGVQDPDNPQQNHLVLALADGAMATSSSRGRSWRQNGRPQHHLIDPRTAAPAISDLHTVTVLAPTAVQAEVAAKVSLLLGREAGRQYLEQRGLSAILFDQDGGRQTVGALPVEEAVYA